MTIDTIRSAHNHAFDEPSEGAQPGRLREGVQRVQYVIEQIERGRTPRLAKSKPTGMRLEMPYATTTSALPTLRAPCRNSRQLPGQP